MSRLDDIRNNVFQDLVDVSRQLLRLSLPDNIGQDKRSRIENLRLSHLRGSSMG